MLLLVSRCLVAELRVKVKLIATAILLGRVLARGVDVGGGVGGAAVGIMGGQVLPSDGYVSGCCGAAI